VCKNSLVLQSRFRKHEEMAVKVAAAFIFMLFLLSTACQAKLSSAFYDKSCPKAESTIRTAIRTAIARERRMAASLIRLHFHDCFVQVLLQLAAIVLL
jgi:peroxidase